MNPVPAVTEIAHKICVRLESEKQSLKSSWAQSSPVQHFVVDNLLPADWVRGTHRGFPEWSRLNRYDSIRERKSSSADMDSWGEMTRNCFLALQYPDVLKIMSEITGIQQLEGDVSAYAGGVSAMREGDFLNPHLDNSTHPKIQGYRRLNALFYVTPDWSRDDGGNLELWAKKLQDRTEVASVFNRLVVMNTNRQSLHSVNRVVAQGKVRTCVSNYYFTKASPHGYHYHHITSFRGRPNEPLKDLYLQLEAKVGSLIQTIKGKPIK